MLRILDTAQLQGQLKVIGVQIVPVLHPARHTVPLRTVGDSVGESIPTWLLKYN
jgi:hypothetical protein